MTSKKKKTPEPPAPTAYQKLAEILRGPIIKLLKERGTPVDGADPRQLQILDLEPMIRMLIEETDRGCLLTTTAFLSDLLEDVIRSRFTELSNLPTTDLDTLLTRQPMPPIGSLGMKIIIAQGLGLILPSTRRAIGAMKDLRNDHAHGWNDFKLKKEDVQPIFDRLTPQDQEVSKGNEDVFKHMRTVRRTSINFSKLTDERCLFAAISINLMINIFLDPVQIQESRSAAK